MTKTLCPGFGQSCRNESVEKRERERPIFLGVHGKSIKPLHRTTHEGTGHPLEEVLKAQVKNELGRLPCPQELAMEKEKEPQPPGSWHHKM